MSDRRQLRCELFVNPGDVDEVSDRLLLEGVMVFSGDPECLEGRQMTPIVAIGVTSASHSEDAPGAIAAHASLIANCLDAMNVHYVMGECALAQAENAAIWLDVIATTTLSRTGMRIRAESESDVDVQLAALAKLLGEPRTNLTVLPPADWPR